MRIPHRRHIFLMLVEVHHTGEQFQAFDSKGNRITNREILEDLKKEAKQETYE